MNCKIEIVNGAGTVLYSRSGDDEAYAVYDNEYADGDKIRISCSEKKVFVLIKLDDCMDTVLVYLSDAFLLPVPFNEHKLSYNPKSFSGKRHYLYMRKATETEVKTLRNLALNPYDCHENKTLFPHTWANVETRGESVFASRNAVDGLIANTFHGEWPYSSWGINRDPEAEFHLDFGRSVVLHSVTLYLRADFPHDAWWKSAGIEFSDGSVLTLALKKTGSAQLFAFEPRTVTGLVLQHLIKEDDDSPFPALTQIEAFGTEA
jgi:hypothetical protein